MSTCPSWWRNLFTSIVVMPSIPSSFRASLTSSTLKGLMIASIFFISSFSFQKLNRIRGYTPLHHDRRDPDQRSLLPDLDADPSLALRIRAMTAVAQVDSTNVTAIADNCDRNRVARRSSVRLLFTSLVPKVPVTNAPEPHSNSGHRLAVERLWSKGQPEKRPGRNERHGVDGQPG